MVNLWLTVSPPFPKIRDLKFKADKMDNKESYNATREFCNNIRHLYSSIVGSIFRHGKPTSNRERSQVVFQNFFLHIHSVRTHLHSLKWTTTFGLGIISAILFVLLTITGILLMFYYKPTIELAYSSIKDIHYIVPTGRLIRNIHRWAAHAMVIAVLFHMARVFYTSAYKKGREFNWIIGLSLLVFTLALSFTGYLLPWDQLAYWATTISANIAESPREITDALGITQFINIGGLQKTLLLGSRSVGQEALTRFYVLHIVVLPLILTIFLGVHFWRIRKDGGLTRPLELDAPEEKTVFPESPTKSYGLMALVKGKTGHTDQGPENTVLSWPNTFYAELALAMCTIAVLLLLSFFLDAPLKEPANPLVPENPAKAPWYFLGLQELISYSAFMGGIGIPAIVMLGLGLIPFLDRETDDIGIWFGGKRGVKIALRSFLFATFLVVGLLVFNVNFGWLRLWFPELPQLVITVINPGTFIVLMFSLWSLYHLKKENSIHLSAIALFTCFLVGFIILTYFATVHRGPNWDFYWSQSDWPKH